MLITQAGLALQRIQMWKWNHKVTQNHIISKKMKGCYMLRISRRFCGCFEKNSTGNYKENLRTVYNLFDHWNNIVLAHFLQTSSICFEDGSLLLALLSSSCKMLLCLSVHCNQWASLIVAGPIISWLFSQELAI